ncbi:SRPBCC family protein [Candidatus Acetothermia bacterium]|nr:SRPBCC family protein [Candidatus Acetothermia bacterium]MBI3643645.1 SRPBCC family protein [Candidatus Acetothermia bacterium]
MTKIKDQLIVSVSGDREVVLTRLFDAPLDLVFAAFTTREHLERWWGLRKTTTRVEVLDFRPGGAWRFVERTEDETKYVFRGMFLDIKSPERFVWTFEYEGAPGQISQTTFQFTEEKGKTKMTATVLFASDKERDEMIKAGMEYGAAESYDVLDELLLQIGGLA